MELSITSESIQIVGSDCLVIGVFEGGKLTPGAQQVDRAGGGWLGKIAKRGDCDGKAGSVLLLPQAPGCQTERLLLVGLGKADETTEANYLKALTAAFSALRTAGIKSAAIFLSLNSAGKRDFDWRLRQIVFAAADSVFRVGPLKEHNAKPKLARLLLAASDADKDAAQKTLKEAEAIAAGMSLAKELANLPPNVCTPSYLAKQAEDLAKRHKLKCEVLDQEEMEKLGMNTLLSVARGSQQPPKFIVLRYQGADKKVQPIALIGKGITFDSGGISLKPGADMDEMKYDMSGAAAVLGALLATALLELPLNLVVAIPATENMPGGNASRPGDIVKSMSGQTVEILNTDAEGRLILCDALTYVERFAPACVIDVATLTGACVIALGNLVSGLLGNDEKLIGQLLAAGESAWDRAWQLPLFEEYQELLTSNFADIPNISGGRGAGTITAACFLSRFAKKYRWAHLDIAGTAWRSGKEKGATGRPVPLLAQFLIAQAA